ncbi:ras-domain-containing protein [Atractiella rhizophila]|nr:ras-domain-containing protein [Atractiella rhizophila]
MTELTELIESHDYLIKIIIIGSSNVGKSSFVQRFLTNTFRTPSSHTIGVEFSSTLLRLPPKGTKVKVQIWDTAGQERFRSVTRNYYRGSAGCILMYDITDRSSFLALPQWLSDIRTLCPKNCVVLLVGNKADVPPESRQVSLQEAEAFASQNDILHLELSALEPKEETPTELPFIMICTKVLAMIDQGLVDPRERDAGISLGEGGRRRGSMASSASTWGRGWKESGRERWRGGRGGSCC